MLSLRSFRKFIMGLFFNDAECLEIQTAFFDCLRVFDGVPRRPTNLPVFGVETFTCNPDCVQFSRLSPLHRVWVQ